MSFAKKRRESFSPFRKEVTQTSGCFSLTALVIVHPNKSQMLSRVDSPDCAYCHIVPIWQWHQLWKHEETAWNEYQSRLEGPVCLLLHMFRMRRSWGISKVRWIRLTAMRYFIWDWNARYVLFATGGLSSKTMETKDVVRWRPEAVWDHFIVKQPPLQIKIYPTDSGRNIHNQWKVHCCKHLGWTTQHNI